MANTVKKIAMPGNVTVHGASRMKSRLSPISLPQLMTFGSDNPKKLSAASNKMATPTVNAALTIKGGSALGKMVF